MNAVTPGYTHWYGPLGGGGTSCASATFCVMVSGDAFVFSSGRWSQTALTGGLPQNVSCAPSTPGGSPFCMVATSSGNVLTYDGTAWSAPVKVDTGVTSGGTEDVSCVSASFCVLTDSAGGIMTWDGTSWTQTVAAVSCTSATFCAAVDEIGNTYTFDGKNWSAAYNLNASINGLTGTDSWTALSCGTPKSCVIVSQSGDARVGTSS